MYDTLPNTGGMNVTDEDVMQNAADNPSVTITRLCCQRKMTASELA